MTADDLSTPLGQSTARPRRRVIPRLVLRLASGALGSALIIFGGWALLVDDPLGGEPFAVVAPAVPHSQVAPDRIEDHPAAVGADHEKPSPPHRETITIIDGMSGKRQEVPIVRDPAPGIESGAGGSAGPVQDGAARSGSAVDQQLIETRPHGATPKIGPDGAMPADAHAHPANAAADVFRRSRTTEGRVLSLMPISAAASAP